MTKKMLTTLLIAETVLLVLIFFHAIFVSGKLYFQAELVREVSPDGRYTVRVARDGAPAWPYGDDHFTVSIRENSKHSNYYCAAFSARVSNNGVPGGYEVEWLEDGVKITLYGNEQSDAVYILPFETFKKYGKSK